MHTNLETHRENSERNRQVKTSLKGLWKEEEGQDLLEYALLLALIVLTAVAAINPLGETIASVFKGANSCTESAVRGGGCTTT
jgi:Flp pilus assembly pilin Flp